MKPKHYIYLIVGIGYIVFFNSFFNGFVLDDLFQIVNNPNILGWNNLFYFFSHEIGPYYRPLMLTTFSVFHNLGSPSFFYHFFQVNLHILNTVLVFYFLNSFLKKEKLSLFLSIVFLVHPINIESVNYASELQETYFMFFGLLGLMLLSKAKTTRKTLILLSLTQILALLSKETAALFILMQILYVWLFLKKHFVKYLFSSLSIVTLYLSARLLLFGSIDSHKFQIVIPNSPSAASFTERLINMPGIILFYIKTFFFPKDLAVSQLWWNKIITVGNFYLPLLVDISVLFIIIFAGSYIYRRRKEFFPIFIFFGSWFLIGLGAHSQLVSLDWTVAERWFYFSMVGLLGLIGVCLKGIIIKNQNTKKVIILCSILLLVLFSLRTVVRNTNWYSQLALTSHDIALSKDSGDLELNFGLALSDAGRYDEAILHLKRASALMPSGFTVWDALGGAYAKSGQYEKAVASYKKAISINKDYYASYKNLAIVYLYYKKANDAKTFLEKEALIKWPSDAFIWRMLGFADVMRKDNQGALDSFKKAYELSPDEQNLYYYTNLKENKEVMLRL
jgi:tetratricopeptide (TPR) repeat protein